MIGLILFLMFGSSSPSLAQSAYCTCGMLQGFVDSQTKKCVPKIPSGKCEGGQFYCSSVYTTYRDGKEEPVCAPVTECGQQARACRSAYEAKLGSQGPNNNYTRYWAEQTRSALLSTNSIKRHDAGPQSKWKTWREYCNANTSDPDCKERIALANYVKDVPAPPAEFARRQAQMESSAFQAEYGGSSGVDQNQQFSPKGMPIGETPAQPSSDGGQLWNCLGRVSYLDPISCVACGLEEATGVQGVDRYVGMLGVMAQAYQGTEDLERGPGIQDLQLKVIGMISDYGYCTNSEYGGSPETSHQKAISAGINRKKDSMGFFGIGAKKFNKSESYRALGLPSDAKSESRLKTMFRRDRMPTGLQQIRFGEQSARFTKESGGAAANSCFKAMDKRRRAQEVCEQQCAKGKGKLTKCGRKFQGDRLAARDSLYVRIAQTCGIQVSDPKGYPGCSNPEYIPNGGGNDNPGTPGKGGEKENDRPDGGDPGKGGEDSSDRGDGPGDGGGGKGGEDGGSRGDGPSDGGGSQGKGGESGTVR